MGAPAGFENTLLRGAWSKDDGGRRVAVGGADRMVCIWEVDSGRIQYKVGFFLFVYTQLSHHTMFVASWPQGHGDVCRFPPQGTYQYGYLLSLLTACIDSFLLSSDGKQRRYHATGRD